MKDHIFYLPDYFTGERCAEVYIHPYTAAQSSVKNKVVFTHHMLCLLQQGVKEVLSPGGNVRIDATQLLLLTAGSVLMSESVPESGRFESTLLFFSNAFLAGFLSRHQVTLQPHPEAAGPVWVLPKDGFIRHYETSLQLLQPLSDAHLQQVKLEELLLYLLRAHPAPLQAFFQQALQADREVKFRQTVLTHLEENLTIAELAFLCHMSVSTFKRAFTEVFHTSPGKYLIEKRMQQARQLLQHRRPSEIYPELGYESLSSFSSEFRKFFGKSPKQFQQELEPAAQVFEPLA